ncbi:thioredoxin family protein [Tenacibaculum sp. IB213877]|uniref:thioredoxin family protein n=1 Tax=Tenacibaculum sp. IB213877 TaxID=3097351 RepID=UPI002A5B0D14|nr:thioredoxin family protein [Tenacibaculum sp. IB213877]MDY0781077.1 thioredoxin family protein [Tenacibaculum sp. IB213877]
MKTFKSILILTVVLVATAFTVKTSSGYEVGDVAGNFTLKNIDGNMVSLSDYNNEKGVIVVFTCNHCPYSKMYEDRIIALDKKYKEKGYPVVAINPNDPSASPGDDFESMKERAKSKGFTFPYLFDDGQKVYPKFGATRTPHVFVLKKAANNKFVVSYIGAIDNNARDAASANELYVEEAVNSLLEGKQPEKTLTKTIGCSIKVAS